MTKPSALFGAYLAWHRSGWGVELNEIFGTWEDGHIVGRKELAELD